MQKLSSERPSSDGEGVVENGISAICNGKEQGEILQIESDYLTFTNILASGQKKELE